LTRRFGHIRDTHRPTGLTTHAALVGSASTTADVLLSADVLDQRGTSSCTGYGHFARLIDVRARFLGYQGAAASSARWGYTLGRERMLADPKAVLTDDGCMPSWVIEGGRSEGALSEDACPFSDDPAVLNARLSFGQLQHARGFRIADVAVIEDTGDACVRAMCAALAAGFPIGFGMQVDQSYEDLGPNDVYEGPNGPSKGGHSQAVVGYVRGVFIVAGSWGRGFADGGFAKIAPSFFARADATFDRYIAHVVPFMRAA
jgi:hypothetical protein